MESFKRRPVENLLQARSVAIVGASPKGLFPRQILGNLRQGGYKGNIYLVNPNYHELWGDKCYPNLTDLPEPAEHLVTLVPTEAVLQVLEAGSKAGARAATVYSAGFGEGDDAEGKERARAIRDLCEHTGMVCCGPNCLGSFSVVEGLWSFAHPIPLLRPGPVGLIFQSGGSMRYWVRGASERGIGFSYAVSSGNEVSLDMVDYLSFLVDDPQTKLIALMVEGIRRPREFANVAAQALSRNKPILVVKLGKSEAGRRQAVSHTGALAGADEVFEAFCHRIGLVRCPTLEDLMETTLAFLPGRFPRGRRAAIVVNSGGMKGLLCDYIEELGTELAELDQKTREALRPLIPADLAVENPLECGVAGFGDEQGFANIVALHAQDEGVDLLGIHGELPRGEKRDAAPLKNLAAVTDKPILAFSRSTYSLTDDSRSFQELTGLPFLQAIRPALRALDALGLYGERKRLGIPALPPATGNAQELQGDAFSRLLGIHGLALPRQAIASSSREAALKAKDIGFPVALKLHAADVLHKTELGAVVLNLRSCDETEQQGEQLLAKSRGGKLLVQEMIGGTEVLLGARIDPQFGPFIMVGLGGIFVEALKDVALRLLPVSEQEASAMLKELKGYAILEGVRGQVPRDIAALVRAITGLSDLFAKHRLHFSDLEFNPLIVREEGKGVAAVDVRVVRNIP